MLHDFFFIIIFSGTCVDLVNNYTCNCYAGFTGSRCDAIIVNCSKESCYENVTCFENNQGITCGPCPPGLTGDGKICEGKVVLKEDR